MTAPTPKRRPAPLELLVLRAVEATDVLRIKGKRRHITAAYGRCVDAGWIEYSAMSPGVELTEAGRAALRGAS